MKIDVLDHGFVRLVSYMQPAAEFTPGEGIHNDIPGDWTGDLEIIRNARTSYNADWRTGEDGEKDAKLMRRLISHRHTTPQEAMVFTFEVKAPIFVFRQWHRHRTWTYNEVSARYTELPTEFYVPKAEHIGKQSKTDKQTRDMVPDELADKHFKEIVEPAMLKAMEDAFTEYRILLRNGVPRELARIVLPLATYSRMFATVDLHNLFHFLDLRLDEHAQYEIRVYAQALLDLVRPICPVAVAEWEKRPKQLTAEELDAVGQAVDDQFEMGIDDDDPESKEFESRLLSAAAKLFPGVKKP
jgi:thymidylate synthase (FAD)